MAKWDLSRKRPTARDGAVSKPCAAPNVNPNGPVPARSVPFRDRPPVPNRCPAERLGNHWQNRSRGNSTIASPVATFSPAWFFTITSISTQRDFSVACLALMMPGGLDGVAGPHRLDPPRLQPAVDRAGGIGPVGDHARDQPEIVHAVHDDAAEIGLAEIALHVVVVEMQRVVVERGIAEQADGFARRPRISARR